MLFSPITKNYEISVSQCHISWQLLHKYVLFPVTPPGLCKNRKKHFLIVLFWRLQKWKKQHYFCFSDWMNRWHTNLEVFGVFLCISFSFQVKSGGSAAWPSVRKVCLIQTSSSSLSAGAGGLRTDETCNPSMFWPQLSFLGGTWKDESSCGVSLLCGCVCARGCVCFTQSSSRSKQKTQRSLFKLGFVGKCSSCWFLYMKWTATIRLCFHSGQAVLVNCSYDIILKCP